MTQANKNISNALFNSFKNKKPIDFVSENYNITEEEAYLTQDDLIEQLKFRDRTHVAGYKVSMTSATTQAIAHTNEPAYGTILSDKIVNNGDAVSLSSLFSPLLEPEIMFIAKEDLPYDADLQTIILNTEIAAGIEIPDARYKDWFPNFTLGDLICDDTATGLIVVGNKVDPLDIDAFAHVQLNLYKDEELIATGDSSEVLGNPLNAVLWLIKKLHSHGKQIKKGQVISSGTFISPLKLEYGTYRAEYSGIGTVEFKVSK